MEITANNKQKKHTRNNYVHVHVLYGFGDVVGGGGKALRISPGVRATELLVRRRGVSEPTPMRLRFVRRRPLCASAVRNAAMLCAIDASGKRARALANSHPDIHFSRTQLWSGI